jgi:hypothetical protein|tara:strand:+ start:746 stop:973 length:228 start_codon:yes stop_codon:yes gene_type:complete
MAIEIREDNGIKKVGKTFEDGVFLEIEAVLNSEGAVDTIASEKALDNMKVQLEFTPEQGDVRIMHWAPNDVTEEL